MSKRNDLRLSCPVLCQDDIAALGAHYRDGEHCPPSAALAKSLRDEVMDLFRALPVKVEFKAGPEPFDTLAEMEAHLHKHGVLLIQDYAAGGWVSHVWPGAYNELRAVHDWFGHISAKCPFGITGEVNGYLACKGIVSDRQLPYLWNETVLANAHQVAFGKGLGWDKVVPSGEASLEHVRTGAPLMCERLPGWVG